MTHLFDADRYHFLYDGATCLGFQKAAPGLRALGPQFTGKYSSRMVIDRGTLLGALGWLGAVSPYHLDGKFLVTLRVEGCGPHAKMWWQTWDEARKSRGVSTMEFTRTSEDGKSYVLPTYRISISLKTLRDVIAHFDSANVVLEELCGGQLRIQDEGPEFWATSWIGGVLPVPEEKLAPPGRYIGDRQNQQASPSLARSILRSRNDLLQQAMVFDHHSSDTTLHRPSSLLAYAYQATQLRRRDVRKPDRQVDGTEPPMHWHVAPRKRRGTVQRRTACHSAGNASDAVLASRAQHLRCCRNWGTPGL